MRNFYKDAGKLADFEDVEKLFEGNMFVGFKMAIKHATPDEMRQLLKHIKTIGYNTKGIKTLQDVRDHQRLIAAKKNEVIVKYNRFLLAWKVILRTRRVSATN